MNRLYKENTDLKSKFEQLQTDEKDKFEEIKKKLGLEYSVSVLLSAKSNSKEMQYL
jgi:hypothetical protein